MKNIGYDSHDAAMFCFALHFVVAFCENKH